jgi:NADH:ubiquinone reductase (H+-translocating)
MSTVENKLNLQQATPLVAQHVASLAAHPHVVIVGCGFGGLEAAKAFSGAPVRVTVIDRHNHHLFQPLLYQVATAGLAAPAIAEPIRRIFAKQRNVTVLMGDVTDINPVAKTVTLHDGNALQFDHLIVAAGATHSYFGNDAWQAHAPGLKTLSDAFLIRRRLLNAFEQAERLAGSISPDALNALLTSVVIGAGPTGVEMAGTMIEIARHTLKGEFRNIRSDQARVVLVEGGSRVLGTYPESLSASALAQLQKLGVEVRLNARVTAIEAAAVTVTQQGETVVIAAATKIWAAGVAASPLATVLAKHDGIMRDRAGRVQVEPDLSLRAFAHISVVGDMAAASSYVKGVAVRAVPGVSPGAKQAGQHAARMVLRRLAQQPTTPFRYVDYGDLATIGRNAAIASVAVPVLGALRFSGLFAWLFWLCVHIFFLIGFRNRFVVMMDWAWAYFTFDRNARIVVGDDQNTTS